MGSQCSFSRRGVECWWRGAKRTSLAAKFWIFWRSSMTELGVPMRIIFTRFFVEGVFLLLFTLDHLAVLLFGTSCPGCRSLDVVGTVVFNRRPRNNWVGERPTSRGCFCSQAVLCVDLSCLMLWSVMNWANTAEATWRPLSVIIYVEFRIRRSDFWERRWRPWLSDYPACICQPLWETVSHDGGCGGWWVQKDMP